MEVSFISHVIVGVALCCGGCGPYADPISPDGNPECGSAKLGVIMTEYALELDAACKGNPGGLQGCTGSERQAIDKKYDDLFRQWAECE